MYIVTSKYTAIAIHVPSFALAVTGIQAFESESVDEETKRVTKMRKFETYAKGAPMYNNGAGLEILL